MEWSEWGGEIGTLQVGDGEKRVRETGNGGCMMGALEAGVVIWEQIWLVIGGDRDRDDVEKK